MGRPFLASYLAGEPSTRRFLSLDFRDPAARLAQIKRASTRLLSPPVLHELTAQNAALPPSAARQAHLEALATPGTTVVVTGQQVGLFLGPLYTFYKAATAVAVARELQAESGIRCVPLFWLQTEDHDFAEIATHHVLAADGPRSVTIAADPEISGRSSIAHARLGKDVEPALAALADALGGQPSASEVMTVLRAHYRPGVPVAQAFAGVLAELFAEDGLVIWNPRVLPAARLSVPIYRRAIDEHVEIGGLLGERKRELEAAGLELQVPVRGDCPLVFFHEGTATGPRYRLQRSGSGRDPGSAGSDWSLTGGAGRVSAAELSACLSDDPLRFSTSALLRPLVQDTLFPVAATVGGPAELGYFAQIGPLYERFSLPQPLVVPRARFRCLDDKTRSLLARLRLKAADLERPELEITRELAESLVSAPSGGRPAELPSPSTLAAELETALAPALARLSAVVTAADPNLAGPADRTGQQLRHAMERLIGKYAQALCRRDDVTRDRLERVQAALYPARTPQERFYGWPSMAARTGRIRFEQAVRRTLVPFSPEVTELCP